MKRLLMLGVGLVATTIVSAQTIRIDSSRTDSLYAMIKAGGTTFDSAHVVWSYNGASGVRFFKANQTDTLRWVRATTPVVQRDNLRIDYYTHPKPKSFTFSIASRVVLPPPPTPHGASPIAPATFVPMVPTITRSVAVAAGTDLQAVLNAAQSGDELVLADNGVWIGNYTYSAKGEITLRCATVPSTARMPVPSCRVETRNTEAALRTNGGASKLRVVGLELAHNPPAGADSVQNYGIVVFGRGDETTLATMPSDITLDRVWVHSASNMQTRRCVAFNGMRLAIINSWLSDCHSKGFDTQGVGGWNGPGPFLIEGNHIEASGQSIMFGGADPRIRDVSPADITIRHNHLFKPLAWGRGRWTVKAAFELKHGKRVLFEGNVIENHWADAQNGFAVLLQGLSDNNTAWEWTAVTDVLIRDNWIINATSGANLLSRVSYNGGPTLKNPMQRVMIVNNWWDKVGKDPFSNTPSIAFQLLNDLQDVTLANNTFTCTCSMQKALSFDGNPQTRTTIVDNVFGASTYVLTGNGTATGKWTLDVFAPGATFLRNTLPGARVQDYNAGALGNAAGADTLHIKAATAGVVR